MEHFFPFHHGIKHDKGQVLSYYTVGYIENHAMRSRFLRFLLKMET